MGLDELQSPQQNQAPPASLLHQRHQKWESVAPLSDLPENFQTTRQAVSKHLRKLNECELVKQECKGREIFYSLKIEKMKEIDKWLSQFKKIWATRYYL